MTDLMSGISFAVQMLHPCLLKIHYLPLNLKLSSRRNQIDLACLDRAKKNIRIHRPESEYEILLIPTLFSSHYYLKTPNHAAQPSTNGSELVGHGHKTSCVGIINSVEDD